MTIGNVELRPNNRYLSSFICRPIGCVCTSYFLGCLAKWCGLCRGQGPPKLLFFLACDQNVTGKEILNVVQTSNHLYLTSVDFRENHLELTLCRQQSNIMSM